MKIILLIFSGALAGVFGGMGMGGGTFLIPLLIIGFSVDAHVAAVVNLLSFIPTAIVSLIIHAKNGLIEKKGILYMVIPALVTAVGAYFLAKGIKSSVMSKIFGVFLLILSIISFISLVRKRDKKKTR